MREIVIPRDVQDAARNCNGRALQYAVCVNWPELRLTEEQVVANAIAWANGMEQPFPDNSIFSIVLER